MMAESFLQILPVFVVIGLGFVAGRVLKITEDRISFLLSLALYFFVPCLLFISVVDVGVPDGALTVVVAVLLVVLVTSAVAFVVANRLGIDNESKKSFLLGAMFMNMGSMGSTIAFLIWGPRAFVLAMIAYVVVQFLFYTLGVMIASSNGKSVLSLKSARHILSLPPFYALLFGMIVSSNHVVVPPQLLDMVGLVGAAAVPTLLISLGMQMSLQMPRLSGIRLPLISSTIRVGGGTAIALCLLFLLPGFDIAGQGVIVIIGTMPTMTSTMLVASKYECNQSLLSMTIAISFVMSAFSLFLVAR